MHTQSHPLWGEPHVHSAVFPLDENLDVDVCVVGAGVAGLSIARELMSQGRTVAMIDAGTVGSGETHRSTAHLSVVLDTRYSDLVRAYGRDRARLVAASHASAIDRIERTIAEEKISCGFQRLDGFLCAERDSDVPTLARELAAAHEVGLDTVTRTPAPPSRLLSGPTLCFPHQAQLDPASYAAGLVQGLLRRGLRIAEHTRMTHLEPGPRPCVHTDRGARIRADQVVFASHTPVNDLVTMHTKQWATRTYAIAVTIPKGSVPVGLFWDMGVPYHYVRLVVTPAEHDWLIVGGEDHRTGQPGDRGDRWEHLLLWARERVPDLGVVVARWSGQIIESVDGLAYIGANPGKHGNVFVVSAMSGNGMTYGTIAAEVLGALLSGRESPYGSVYDPARRPRRAVRAFLRENLNTAGQYRDWVLPASVADEADISPGEGGVVREGLSLLAIYRDNTGALHRCSAVCPHLGGAVRWNAAERSWDCPCHGSRFSPDGQVLNGPATAPLAPHLVAKPAKLAAE